jgi:endonuclease YncB( thermonuclease family)
MRLMERGVSRMTGLIDTRQLPTPARPFVHRGRWTANSICDARVQSSATLRVSMLAGLITFGLMAAPELRLSAIDKAVGPSITISVPEIAVAFHDTSKGLQRVPSLEDITSSAPVRGKSMIVDDEPPFVLTPKATPLDHVEIIDAATIRSGDKTLRLAGIETPKTGDTCKRLDGLAVSCQDRALSYLQLLVKGRKIACVSIPLTSDGAAEGHCRFGETDLAEQLVRQGWAKAGALPEERIVTAELAAKRQKLGIWRP